MVILYEIKDTWIKSGVACDWGILYFVYRCAEDFYLHSQKYNNNIQIVSIM